MEKVLVCLLASTRAHQLTFPSVKRQVLDELNADLALALAIDEKYDYANPFWQHAKYRWTAPTYTDYGEAYDWVQRWLCLQYNVVPAPDWRSMLRIKAPWQGGIRSPDPQPGASSMLPFCRWLLLSGLQRDEILNRYDRFVISRSDFVWLCPHPPLSVLDRKAIWVPEGENYGGLNDRHLVASRADVVSCLDLIEDVLLDPINLYEEIKTRWVDNEQLLLQHLFRKGLLQKVKRFPYVMYLARELDDEGATYSRGRYEPTIGHYVKYDNEFKSARNYATIIRTRADWENKAWVQFDADSAVSRPISLLRRFRYACESNYYFVRSALRRPGRIARFMRYCARRFNRAIRRATSPKIED